MHIIFMPSQDLHIMDWLSHNNPKHKDQEIDGMRLNVNAISTSVNIPVCTSIQNAAKCEDTYLQELKTYIM